MKKKVYLPFFLPVLFISLNSIAQAPPTPFAQRSTYERLIQTKKEYQEAVASGDSLEIAELSYRLGKRYQDINDAQNTIYYFSQAIQIRKSIGSSIDLAKIYQRMAEMYFYRQDLTQSQKYFRLAIRHFENTAFASRMAECYNMIGEIHQQKAELAASNSKSPSRANYDSAFYYFRHAAEVARRFKFSNGVGRAYYHIGILFLHNSENLHSIESENIAFSLFLKEKDYGFTINSALIIAHNYMILGQMRNSKQWLEKADSVFVASNGPASWKTAYLNLSREYYKIKGDWKNAYLYQEQTYQSGVQNEEINRKSVAEGAQLLYESEQRESLLQTQKKELELALTKENQTKQTWLSVFVALLFLISGIAGIIYYRLFLRYRAISLQNEELIKEQSHRIKNNLQSVSDLLTLQLYELSDPNAVQALEESLARINAMSLIHRRLYQRGQSETIELLTFIPDLVADVLRSYQLSSVSVLYDLDNMSLPADKAITLALLLNELTTNACKYAFKDNSDPLLEITCRLSGQNVTVNVRDNGPGFTASASPDTFGMKLIPILVKKLKGRSNFSYDNGMNFHLLFTLTGKNVDKKELTTH